MVFGLLTFILWGFADLFYKKGNSKKDDKYSDLKTGIIVGIVMGLYSLIYMIVKKVEINIIDIIDKNIYLYLLNSTLIFILITIIILS